MAARPGGSSLSGTLNTLLRAQHGTALDDVEDSDLDKRIAEIMVKDAKERQKQWGTMGFSAYLDDLEDSDGPTRKTNKRFLASMIRNVDQHNQALIQQELDNAQQAQRERSKEDRSRSSRLFGSALSSAARSRSDKGKERAVGISDAVNGDSRVKEVDQGESSSSRRHRDRSDSPHAKRRRHRDGYSDESDYEREREQRRRRRRDEDERRSSRTAENDGHSRRSRDEGGSHRSRDDASSSKRHRDRRKDDDECGKHRSSRRDHSKERTSRRKEDGRNRQEVSETAASSRTRTRSPSESRRSQEPSVTAASAQNGAQKKLKRADLEGLHPTELFMLTGGASIELSPSPPPSKPARRKPRTPPPVARVQAPVDDEDDRPGIVPPPTVASAAPSKMDKYFEKTYDPRLDVSLDDLTDPQTGFIKEGAFDDWEVMMEVMKAQRDYKKEKGMREAEERFQAGEREAAKRKAKERAADEEKDRKRRRKLGIASDEDDYGPHPASKVKSGLAAPGPGMFGYRYVKQGGTREWDLAKETPT